MEFIQNDWEEWFAWYPITHKGEFIWFKKIWRRFEYVEVHGFGTCMWVEYATLEDYLATK
jgi:hypothetical protein